MEVKFGYLLSMLIIFKYIIVFYIKISHLISKIKELVFLKLCYNIKTFIKLYFKSKERKKSTFIIYAIYKIIIKSKLSNCLSLEILNFKIKKIIGLI